MRVHLFGGGSPGPRVRLLLTLALLLGLGGFFAAYAGGWIPALAQGEEYVAILQEREETDEADSYIQGALVDGQGHPIPGARFHLQWCCPEGSLDFPLTDEPSDGRFRFTVPSGVYAISVAGLNGRVAEGIAIPDDGRRYTWTILFQRQWRSFLPFVRLNNTPTPVRLYIPFVHSSPPPTPVLLFMPLVHSVPATPTPVKVQVPRPPTLDERFPPVPVRLERPEEARARLQKWPRPADDNGLGMHFLQYGYYNTWEMDYYIARMKELKMKWATVLYTNPDQLREVATRMKATGIMMVSRKMLRPWEWYDGWARDIAILKEVGMPPYMQLYNEPCLETGEQGREDFMRNLVDAAWQVYNGGGYVGLQFNDEMWLREALRRIRASGGEKIFQRMFFVAHPYGLNHPPSYDEDKHAALGFLYFAEVFRQEIGFVPPIIAGEGGWMIGDQQDRRYPQVTEELFRDYYVALFSWFRTGVLSNGDPLPDYLFAFTPWLIADAHDKGAWYNNQALGDRTTTLQAVKALPSFRRRFSWDGYGFP